MTPALMLVLGLGIPSAGANPAEPAGEAEAKPSGRIEFRVRTKHGRGPVRCGLYDNAKDWLTSRYVAGTTGHVKGRSAVCVFEGVSPGRYAVSAYHDQNDNGELDRNFIGLPSEDFCFSSGAKAGLGPPSFKDADFSFDGSLKKLSGKM